MQDKFDFHRDVIIYLMHPDFLTVFMFYISGELKPKNNRSDL